MNNWNIDHDDLFSEERQTLPLALASIAGAVLLLLSAVTSFAFFAEYAPGIFDFISPLMSPYLAGITGVIAFEGMSLVWRYLRANHSDTHRQMAIAQAGSYLSLTGGIAVTVVYFALQTPLLSGIIDQQLHLFLSVSGGILIIVGVSGNFMLWHFYAEGAAQHQAQTNKAEIRAMRAATDHRLAMSSARETFSRTIRTVEGQLPSVSEAQAQTNTARYIAHTFDPIEDQPQSSQSIRKNSILAPQEDEEPDPAGPDIQEPAVIPIPNRNGRHG